MPASQPQHLLLSVLHHAYRTGIVILSPEGVSYPHISFFLIGCDLVQIPMFHHKLQEGFVILKLLLLVHIVVCFILMVDHQRFLEGLVCKFLAIFLPQSEEIKYGDYQRQCEEESED